MRILGIDTSTKFLCIGIYDRGKICEYRLELGNRTSTLLTPAIKRVLSALKWQPQEIDYFACGLGPGSFTGLRVGMAAIKGLSFALKKPVVGISTLDILARNVNSNDKTIVAALDARRNLIYCSMYKNFKGRLKRLTAYLLLTQGDFFQKIKPQSIILGDAVGLYKESILKNTKDATFLEKDYWYPQGRNLIELALEKIKAKNLSDTFKIKPIYLYPKECQIRHG